jgi:hypothetical protein
LGDGEGRKRRNVERSEVELVQRFDRWFRIRGIGWVVVEAVGEVEGD